MKNIIICTILFVLCSSFVFAQNQSSTDYNKKEIFVGYSAYNSANGTFDEIETENNLDPNRVFRGWNASVTYNFKRYIGVKADVSGHYRKDTLVTSPIQLKANSSSYNFMGGIQLKDNKNSKRFSPFAHLLGGVATSKVKLNPSLLNNQFEDSRTGFTAAFGVGLDVKVKKNFSIRLIQVDYNPAYFKGFTEHRVRAGFGIVFH